MDLDLGPEIAQYRAELRDWIPAEAPEGLAELTDWNLTAIPGGYRDLPLAVLAAVSVRPQLRRIFLPGGADGHQIDLHAAVQQYVDRPARLQLAVPEGWTVSPPFGESSAATPDT